MIQAIIFDCFGVLTEDSWHAFRIQLPDGPKQESQELMHQFGAGFIDRQTFVDQVVEVTGHAKPEIEKLISRETGKNTRLLDYIKQLKGHGYLVGMLSNIADNWVRSTFLTAEEQALFDDMVFSFEVGMTKPNPAIFELAAERLYVPPNECLFVDDIQRYCLAAEDAGMKTITYVDFDDFSKKVVNFITKG